MTSPPPIYDGVLGVPLGLALLLVTLFGMCGLFVCCLRWDRLRSIWEAPDPHLLIYSTTHKSSPHQLKASRSEVESLPVLMPGDQVPRFIAMSCPSQPPIAETNPPPAVAFPPPPLF